MSSQITKTVHQIEHVNQAVNWVDTMICKGLESGPVSVTLGRPQKRRNSLSNAKLHAMIGDIQAQGVISMPGRRVTLSEYDTDALKALLVIWFANERAMNGEPLTRPPRSILCPVTGERVSIRPSTAEWGQKDAGEFIEFLYATGNDAGVRWSDPALKAYEEMRESKV